MIKKKQIVECVRVFTENKRETIEIIKEKHN